MKWTIGADIEMMLARHNRLISAVPVLGKAGKKLPHGHIFFDNVLAEFTVTPADNKNDFVKNITANMGEAKRIFELEGIEVKMDASSHYPRGELQTAEAQQFGCDPDFDAYDLVQNEVAEEAHETHFRTAGGHIHFAHEYFGACEEDDDNARRVVEMIKMMDLHLGVPSIIKDSTTASAARRTLYGQAGAHRWLPRYPGGEYRTLSNFWTKDAEGVRWAYEQTEKALSLVTSGETVVSLGYDEQEIRQAINLAATKAALEILGKLNGTD